MSRARRPKLSSPGAAPPARAGGPPAPAGANVGARRASGPASTIEDEPPSGVLFRSDLLVGVPRLAVSPTTLKSMPLDHRAGFIMSFVDGTYTIEMILDGCAMPRKEALAILRELAARGVIVIDV